MSIFESDNKYANKISTNIKDFVIERMQKGEAPNKIVQNVKTIFNKKISLMFILRLRKKYIELTGEHLKSYKEFHNHPKPKRRKISC